MTVAEIGRRSQSVATMRKKINLAILTSLAAICFAAGQESPSSTPAGSPTPEQTPLPSPSASAVRTVQLRFVPPPMEGTISLGIFDSNDKLVRVLHREAKIDNFTIDENALRTTWDGKNDAGEDLPPGKVDSPPSSASDHTSVKLVPNPLVSDTRSVVDVSVGFDSKGSFLETMDGLPLATISGGTNLVRVVIGKDGEKAADVWQDNGSSIEQFRVSNIDKMMAFDCGFFELK